MLEKHFQSKFMHWFLANRQHFKDNVVFEPKVTLGGTFNLRTWRKKQPLQYVRLMDANTDKGVFWKISDLDPRTKPWDCFFISNAPAYLVIYFDKYQTFFNIPVKEIPDQGSISYQDCFRRWKANRLLTPKTKHYEI